jgi:hypothetical protein
MSGVPAFAGRFSRFGEGGKVAAPRLDHAAVFAAIREHLHSRSSLAEKMAAVIAVCERSVPHPDWATLAELPYDRLAPMRNWLRRSFKQHPPNVRLAGLWFGLFNPRRDGATTADLRFGGSTRFTADGGLAWASGLEYRPPTATARSTILESIYRIAYADKPGRLGNPAEWSLALAYAAFAVSQLLGESEPSLILRDADSMGVAVGFDSGDFLLVGRLLPGGWGPPGSCPDAETDPVAG